MSKKQVISLGVVSLFTAGVFLLPGAADAYRGDPSIEGPNCTAERHEAMTAAFANNDYSAWQAQMNGKGAGEGQGTGEGQGQMKRYNR